MYIVDRYGMDFWERVEAEVAKQATTFRWIAESILHKNESTVSTWRLKNTQPRAAESVKIAKALRTTVEYLVDGEDGSRYVKDLVQQEGGVFRPPDRIADIVDGLKTLDDVELNLVRGMVLAGAARHRDVAEGG
jgi:hypothetical protein